MFVNSTLNELRPESYAWRMYFSAALSLLSNAFALYLILRRSPRSLASYRWCLLDIAVSSLLFDLYLAVVYQPLPEFPLPLLCTVGVARYLPPYYNSVIQACVAVWLLGFCAASIVNAFVFRYLAIANKAHWSEGPGFIAAGVLLHFVATLPAVMMLKFGARGTTEVYNDNDESLPCFAIPTALVSGSAVMGEVLFWVFVVSLLSVLSFRALRKLEKAGALSSLRNQRQLLRSLILQVLVPCVSFWVPALMLTCGILGLPGFHDVTPWAFQIFTAHSALNVVAMVAGIRPYRQAVRALFKPWARQSRQLSENTMHANSVAFVRTRQQRPKSAGDEGPGTVSFVQSSV